MGMYGVPEFGGSRFQGFAEHHFRNQVGRVVADYLASDHFAVLAGDHQLDKPVGVTDRDRLPDGPERNLSDLYLHAARLRIRLAKPDRGDFRLAVDAARDREQIEPGLTDSGHNFNRGNALARSLVREEGRPPDISDRIDARAGGT